MLEMTRYMIRTPVREQIRMKFSVVKKSWPGRKEHVGAMHGQLPRPQRNPSILSQFTYLTSLDNTSAYCQRCIHTRFSIMSVSPCWYTKVTLDEVDTEVYFHSDELLNEYRRFHPRCCNYQSRR